MAALYARGAWRAGLRAHRDLRQAGRAGDRLRRSSPRCFSARAVAAARRSRCRCWRPPSSSISPSTCTAPPSCRRSASPASSACSRRPRKPYRTQDGYACILPYSDRNWQDFYDFTGRTEFKDDPRFQPAVGSRSEHRRPLRDDRRRKRPSAPPQSGSPSATGSASRACRCCRSKSCPMTRTSRRWDCSAPPTIRAKAATAACAVPCRSAARRSASAATRPVSASTRAEVLAEAGFSRQEIDQAHAGTGTESNDPKRQETTQP